MRSEFGGDAKSSWPKTVVRKWLNIKSGDLDFLSDCNRGERKGGVQEKRRKSCSDKDGSIFVYGHEWMVESSDHLKPQGFSTAAPSHPSHDLRAFVGTWNVGGRIPHGGLNLWDWLMSCPSPVDICVLGFQEIVPLNAGNVLGAEDQAPAQEWLSHIHHALHTRNKEESPDSLSIGFAHCDDYSLVASKLMVGIFLCIWVRAALMQYVRGLSVSCVGTGIMGYMGNKGSISISMILCQTTFCFVCSHLTSGEKVGDQLRRNSDVAAILRRTKFTPSQTLYEAVLSPSTILEHDRIIWLGDLNYRLAEDGSGDTHELLQKDEWQALLAKDQLRIEQRAGSVFAGWEEGIICFPPTYKYHIDSDVYAVKQSKSGAKRRTPAWCDRILWQGKGMKQLLYARGESRFSDHRPVYSLFNVQMGNYDYSKVVARTRHTGTSWGRVEAEEMLQQSRIQRCLAASSRF